jgi:hypothetical protein
MLIDLENKPISKVERRNSMDIFGLEIKRKLKMSAKQSSSEAKPE